jgi:hypothetical protein
LIVLLSSNKGIKLYPDNVLDSFSYDDPSKEKESFDWLKSKFYPEGDKTAPVLLPELLEIKPGDVLVELDMGEYRAISITRNGKLVSWS